MSIQIPCPQCGRELKLPDRSLLGRKGKCPKCGHTFILEEPPAVTLELAGQESESTTAKKPANPFSGPSFLAEKAPKPVEPSLPNPATVPQFGVPQFSVIEREELPKSPAARLRELQKKNARQRNLGLAIGAVILVAIGGVVMFMPQSAIKSEAPKPETSEAATTESRPSTESDVAGDDSDAASTQYAKLGVPTKGKPIELQYIPFGTQIVLNLHPAELWKEMSPGEEIRYCIPPVAKLVETTLNDLFRRKPQEVKELLICLIPGPRGSLPDIAAVAHMVEDQKRSQLIDQFGKRVDDFVEPVYVSGDRAYMIVDTKTLAVCPKSQAQEMVHAIQQRHPVDEIDALLSKTDRDRHITLIFTPATLSLQESWFAENVRPFLKSSLDWLGADTEAVSWSFHLTEELFYSEILLLNKSASPATFEREFKVKLAKLAEDIMPIVQQMNPLEQGKRMVIGRLPAMVEVFSMATIAHHGTHYVQFITPLPDRAAPNMVLGTLLAWDESTRTDFAKAKPVPTDTSLVPATLAERMKMKIDVEFNRTPMFEAFNFIGGEIKTQIVVDGDSLKLGGFTKNIVQNFQMNSARVQDVIVKIFEESKSMESNPDRTLVIVLNESKKTILVTTLSAAERKGLKPYPLK